MKSIPKQKCTPEFRLEAVKLVLEQGIQTADAVRRLLMHVPPFLIISRCFITRCAAIQKLGNMSSANFEKKWRFEQIQKSRLKCRHMASVKLNLFKLMLNLLAGFITTDLSAVAAPVA